MIVEYPISIFSADDRFLLFVIAVIVIITFFLLIDLSCEYKEYEELKKN